MHVTYMAPLPTPFVEAYLYDGIYLTRLPPFFNLVFGSH